MQLGLGTVQFGLNYGVSNNSGQVSTDEVNKILQLCSEQNITLFDTAAAYGSSEKVLGNAISNATNTNYIVTKLPPITEENYDSVLEQVTQSLENLKTEKLYGLMLHNGIDLLGEFGQQIYEQLIQLKTEGKVEKIGVSIYDPVTTEQIINRFDIDVIQLPINVFDQRFVKSNTLQMLKSKGIEVHARSAFLQGLLLMNENELPDYFQPFSAHIQNYFNNRGENPLVPAIHYLKQLELIDFLIVGVTSRQELAQILLAINQEISQDHQLNYEQFASSDDNLILPTNWKI